MFTKKIIVQIGHSQIEAKHNELMTKQSKRVRLGFYIFYFYFCEIRVHTL